MIELKTLSGELIELNNSEVTIEMNNSLFNDGSKFSGSLSYPINVAFSKRNKLNFGYAQAIETGVKASNLEVYAKIGGKIFRKCVLQIAIDENSFDCNLQIDLGTLNNYISSTTLTQVKFGTFFLGKTKDQIEWAMYNAAGNLDWRKTPYTFFPIRNNMFTGEAYPVPAEIPKFSGNVESPIAVPDVYAEKSTLVNSVTIDGSSVKFNVQTASDPKGKYHTTPFFYLPYILNTIALELGLTLKGDFIQHPDIEKLVVYNVNGTFITRDDNAGYLPQEQHGIYFSASDHLPNITISEFFKILTAYFCVRITPDIDAAELNISWKKSTLEKPVYKDWSEKLIRIRKQEFSASDGYTLSAEVDKLETDKKEVTDIVKVGAGKEGIEIKAGTLRMTEEAMLDKDDLWKIPIDIRPGNIVDPIFKELENYRMYENFNTFPVRFIFSKGIQTFGENLIPYPSASPDGAEILLNLKSMFKFAINPWFSRTYATKKATITFKLSAADICSLQDSDIILFKGENGTTVQALFEKLTFTTKGEYHITAEADLIILDSAYIRQPSGNGMFVRATETNLVTTRTPTGGGSDRIKTTFDLVIEVFADRNCTIPVEQPNLFIYLKQSKSETRANNFIDTNLPTDNKSLRVENDAFESHEYRKLYADTHKLTIPNLIKYEFRYYSFLTNQMGRINSIKVIRNRTFKIQPNGYYTLID